MKKKIIIIIIKQVQGSKNRTVFHDFSYTAQSADRFINKPLAVFNPGDVCPNHDNFRGTELISRAGDFSEMVLSSGYEGQASSSSSVLVRKMLQNHSIYTSM
jgi:hypothetical protein